jgi:hypothetical protein
MECMHERMPTRSNEGVHTDHRTWTALRKARVCSSLVNVVCVCRYVNQCCHSTDRMCFRTAQWRGLRAGQTLDSGAWLLTFSHYGRLQEAVRIMTTIIWRLGSRHLFSCLLESLFSLSSRPMASLALSIFFLHPRFSSATLLPTVPPDTHFASVVLEYDLSLL